MEESEIWPIKLVNEKSSFKVMLQIEGVFLTSNKVQSFVEIAISEESDFESNESSLKSPIYKKSKTLTDKFLTTELDEIVTISSDSNLKHSK